MNERLNAAKAKERAAEAAFQKAWSKVTAARDALARAEADREKARGHWQAAMAHRKAVERETHKK